MPLVKLRRGRQGSLSASEPSESSSPTTSSRSSHGSSATVATNASSTSSLACAHDCSQHASCELDADDYLARLREDVNVSDDCPSKQALEEAGEIMLYDSNGNGRPFKDIVHGDLAIGQRQLILFVRHFYCGACQAYLKALTSSIDAHTYFTMPVATNIIVVGCGAPSMIAAYKDYTGCPFPVFAEPTRALHRALAMPVSLDMGRRRPDYMHDIAPPAWLAGQLRQVGQQARAHGVRQALRGSGNWLQVGGEFLLENGEVVWCHRMRNYRDHTEVKALRKIMEIDAD